MQGANVRFTRVVTDSRALQPGDLFVALAGERFDGHDFVAEALSRAAPSPRWSPRRAPAAARPGNLVVVADTLAALGALAAYWRRRFALPLIAVVGSNGKTTVKEMIADHPARALRRRARCWRRRAISTTRSACR